MKKTCQDSGAQWQEPSPKTYFIHKDSSDYFESIEELKEYYKDTPELLDMSEWLELVEKRGVVGVEFDEDEIYEWITEETNTLIPGVIYKLAHEKIFIPKLEAALEEKDHQIKIKEARLSECQFYIKGYQDTIDSLRREIASLSSCESLLNSPVRPVVIAEMKRRMISWGFHVSDRDQFKEMELEREISLEKEIHAQTREFWEKKLKETQEKIAFLQDEITALTREGRQGELEQANVGMATQIQKLEMYIHTLLESADCRGDEDCDHCHIGKAIRDARNKGEE